MLKKILSMALVAVMCLMLFVGCGLDGGCELPDFSFEGRCVMTEDGFLYYDDTKYGGSKGLCIIKLPDTEEVVIPEYIDGKRVAQLGYKFNSLYAGKDYRVDGSHITKLTIQHTMDYYAVAFPNVETLVFIDVFYCFNYGRHTSLDIDNVLTGPSNYVSIELKKVNKIVLSTRNEEGFTNTNITEVYLSAMIKEIAKDTFAHTNVKIVTTYASRPEGWAEGWNGDCEVQWGVEF